VYTRPLTAFRETVRAANGGPVCLHHGPLGDRSTRSSFWWKRGWAEPSEVFVAVRPSWNSKRRDSSCPTEEVRAMLRLAANLWCRYKSGYSSAVTIEARSAVPLARPARGLDRTLSL